FDVGFAHSPEEFRAVRDSFCAQMFPHTCREEPLARFIEANSGPLFDQHANFAQLVFAQPFHMSLAFVHRAPVVRASLLLSPTGAPRWKWHPARGLPDRQVARRLPLP